MQIVRRLLDYTQHWALPDVYIFTGNPIIRLDGGVVMGRGAARQVRDTYPEVAQRLGSMMLSEPDPHLLFVPIGPDYPIPSEQYIGWFKVKHHWRDEADLGLIAESAEQLASYANEMPQWTFHMNYPGVGNGRLTETQVDPLLQVLPSNVLVYR